MPNVDGYEVLIQFRNHPGTANIPVICSSADSSDTARNRAYQLGAIGFITKPPNMKQLGSDITTFVSNINQEFTSEDQKRKYIVAFNSNEKQALINNFLISQIESNNKIVYIGWGDGGDLFKEEAEINWINNEDIIYFKIKSSLIAKFPYMQDLTPIPIDINSFLPEPSNNYCLIIDELHLLFNEKDVSNMTSRLFSLVELLRSNFKSIFCFSTKTRDQQKDLFLLEIAKIFIGKI